MTHAQLLSLFDAARLGDQDALNEFLGHFLHRLFRYLRRRVNGNEPLADDLTQITFLTLIRQLRLGRWPEFLSERSFFYLLVVIADRCTSRHFQRPSSPSRPRGAPSGAASSIEHGWMGNRPSLPIELVAADVPSVPEVAAIAELVEVVERAMERLSARDRQILDWVLDGLDSREIAEKLGVAGGTVRWRLMQCRDRLVAEVAVDHPQAACWLAVTFRGGDAWPTADGG